MPSNIVEAPQRDTLTSPLRKRLLKAVANPTAAIVSNPASVTSATLSELSNSQPKKVVKMGKTESRKKLIIPQTRFVERHDLAYYLQGADMTLQKNGTIKFKNTDKPDLQKAPKSGANKSQPTLIMTKISSVEVA